MLTYHLDQESSVSLYDQLYTFIRRDIKSGLLVPGERLPSKRVLAGNLGVSSITVENAYHQLMDEGYIQALPKKGYFISESLEITRRYIVLRTPDIRRWHRSMRRTG